MTTRLRAFFPNQVRLRFLFMVRDPVAARLSFFWYVRRSVGDRDAMREAKRLGKSYSEVVAQQQEEEGDIFDEWLDGQILKSANFSDCVVTNGKGGSGAQSGQDLAQTARAIEQTCGAPKMHHAMSAFMSLA